MLSLDMLQKRDGKKKNQQSTSKGKKSHRSLFKHKEKFGVSFISTT
jgi:hypothetical protein